MDGTDGTSFSRNYDLFVNDNTRRLVMRFTDAGVMLGDDALRFVHGGIWKTRSYDDIGSVTLTVHPIGRDGLVGHCTIGFRDGEQLAVMSGGANGLSDAMRTPVYRGFVADLHRRLAARGAEGIAFRAGYSRARATGMNVTMVVAGAFFIIFPLMLFFATGESVALIAMGGGGLLLWPYFVSARRMQPSTYFPDRPPDLLES